MLLTGFPAGMLACNCYVLAQRQGSDAIIVDPGQRAFGPLRRILDENRLTPAAVLLTHGHIDHLWSAQKVADTFGCPVFIHPEDRYMLTDPIRGFGPRIAQMAFGALFREPKQVVELERDGQLLDLGGLAVTVDHTPGHTPGHVSLLHPDSGVLITGDSIFNMNGRMTWPFKAFCTDFPLNRRTSAVLADLDYTTAAFTHGPQIDTSAREAVRGFLRRKGVVQ